MVVTLPLQAEALPAGTLGSENSWVGQQGGHGGWPRSAGALGPSTASSSQHGSRPASNGHPTLPAASSLSSCAEELGHGHSISSRLGSNPPGNPRPAGRGPSPSPAAASPSGGLAAQCQLLAPLGKRSSFSDLKQEERKQLE